MSGSEDTTRDPRPGSSDSDPADDPTPARASIRRRRSPSPTKTKAKAKASAGALQRIWGYRVEIGTFAAFAIYGSLVFLVGTQMYVGGGTSWVDSAPPILGRQPHWIELTPGAPTLVSGGHDGVTTLYLELTDLDPARGLLRGSATVGFDESRAGGRKPDNLILGFGYRDWVAPAVEVEMPVVEYPMIGSGSPTTTVPLALPVHGEARAFPGDSYAATYTISLRKDVGGFYAIDGMVVRAGPRLTGYRVALAVGPLDFRVRVERSTQTAIWVYIVALSPCLLLLVIVRANVKSRRQSDATLAIEVAVGLLAVLPLRQVLVPSDVEGITRVDALLGGIFLMFLLWLAVHSPLGLLARTGQPSEVISDRARPG